MRSQGLRRQALRQLLALSRTAKEAICQRQFFESRRFYLTEIADSVR